MEDAKIKTVAQDSKMKGPSSRVYNEATEKTDNMVKDTSLGRWRSGVQIPAAPPSLVCKLIQTCLSIIDVRPNQSVSLFRIVLA